MILYFANILYFTLFGFNEAILWHYSVNKISRITAKQLHYPLVATRLFWFIWLLWFTDYDYASIIPLFMCYPFIHLGVMYQVRNWLNNDIYIYGFFSNASNSSTSLWDRYLPMDAWLRTLLFIFGTLFYTFWNL